MEFEEDGSETGSAVSDDELDINLDNHGQEHDVEIILGEEQDEDEDEDDDEDDDDDGIVTEHQEVSDESSTSDATSMSELSLSEGSSALSEELEVMTEGDETRWQDGDDISELMDFGSAHAAHALLRELRSGEYVDIRDNRGLDQVRTIPYALDRNNDENDDSEQNNNDNEIDEDDNEQDEDDDPEDGDHPTHGGSELNTAMNLAIADDIDQIQDDEDDIDLDNGSRTAANNGRSIRPVDRLEFVNASQDPSAWSWAESRATPMTDRHSEQRQIANSLWASVAPPPPVPSALSEHPHSSGLQLFRRTRLGEPSGTAARIAALSNPFLSINDAPQPSSDRANWDDNFSDWIESIEALIGGGAVQLIGDIVHRPNSFSGHNPRAHHGSTSIRVDVASDQRTFPGQIGDILRRASPYRNAISQRDDPITAASFTPVPTLQRYLDEAAIIYSTSATEKLPIIIKDLLVTMAPKVSPKVSPETTTSQECSQVQEAENHQRKIAENRHTEIDTEVARPGPVTASSDRPNIAETGHDNDEDLQSTASINSHAASAISETRPVEQVLIRGQSFDVSGLGIDVSFLEALPEDMREEVLIQHVREHRAQEQHSARSHAELTPEFLEALPEEIRTELLQQEVMVRRRLSRAPRRTSPHESVHTENARLGRQLDHSSTSAGRIDAQPFSMVNDEGLIRPAHQSITRSTEGEGQESIVRDEEHNSVYASDLRRDDQSQGSALRRRVNGLQLLDRAGVNALLRLLFVQAPPQRNILHDILLNLCDNRTTRMDIITQLSVILQDGTSDVSAMHKCLSSLVKKAKAFGAPDSPTKVLRTASNTPVLDNMTPHLVALQCLQALSFLLSWNDQLPSYFLVEHDNMSSRKPTRIKGKARETPHRPSKFPINNILLLLERNDFLRETDLLEPLSLSLSIITKPLLLLAKRGESDANRPIKSRASATMVQNAPDAPIPLSDSNTDLKQINSPETEISKSQNQNQNVRRLTPPEISEENLKLIVNLVTADACSGRIFQNTLTTIHHLVTLEEAGTVILKELQNQAQECIDALQHELAELLRALQTHATGSDLQNATLSTFTAATSKQAKFLRILKTMDYLTKAFEKNRNKVGILTGATESPYPSVDSLDSFHLWSELSECLKFIHEQADMIHVATILLPLIEGLMVVCRNANTIELSKLQASRKDLTDPGSINQLFYSFTEDHKQILNQMVRNNPTLMSGSFALLTKNPKVLDFDNKRNYFNRSVKDRGSHREHYPPLQVNVRREAVFLDSYKDLHFKSGNEVKYSKLNIRFVGEEGIDAGGLSREWFQVLARQMFDPNYALFVPVNADRNTYHPNKTSGINPEHLLFFKFVGRIVGKALYDGRLLDCHFSRPVYRKILGKNVSLKDMETLDLDYYKSLLWMLENDITDVISETFSVERDDFGVTNVVDLLPNGRNIAVTEQNKTEYVAKVTEYRLLQSVSEQMDHFLAGFNDIIPADLVRIFNEKELELLISGLPDIDIDDWRNNTEYHNYTTGSPQIQWFWRAIRGFNDEERARVLQFCTGSSRIPVEGFAHLEGMHGVQKFNIHRDYTSGTRLPQSHTCFNQLDLPEYDSYEILRSSLLLAVSEGSEGFGFA